MAQALRLGARRLFGVEKVHLTVLSSSGSAGTIPPSKENFRRAFEEARKARPDDILVVYLAGHGVAVKLSGDNDTYCYLTQEAHGTDLTDPALREAVSITSEEMVEWIKQVEWIGLKRLPCSTHSTYPTHLTHLTYATHLTCSTHLTYSTQWTRLR